MDPDSRRHWDPFWGEAIQAPLNSEHSMLPLMDRATGVRAELRSIASIKTERDVLWLGRAGLICQMTCTMIVAHILFRRVSSHRAKSRWLCFDKLLHVPAIPRELIRHRVSGARTQGADNDDTLAFRTAQSEAAPFV